MIRAIYKGPMHHAYHSTHVYHYLTRHSKNLSKDPISKALTKSFYKYLRIDIFQIVKPVNVSCHEGGTQLICTMLD